MVTSDEAGHQSDAAEREGARAEGAPTRRDRLRILVMVLAATTVLAVIAAVIGFVPAAQAKA